VSDALVAVDERMVQNEGESQRGGLFSQGRIEIDATKRCPGLGESRLEGAKIANAWRSGRSLEEAAMKFEISARLR